MSAIILAGRRLAEEARGPARAEAIAWNLPDEHFSQLVEWKLAGLSHKRLAELAAEELRLPEAKIPGRTSWSEFWSEYWPFYCIARRRANVAGAESLDAEISRQPFAVEGVLRDEIKQRAFELLQQEQPPEKLVKAFLAAVLKMRDQEDRKEVFAHKERQLSQKDRDFALQREKFVVESCEKILKAAKDPATREVAESELSNAEKIARIRETYFADIDALEVELPE